MTDECTCDDTSKTISEDGTAWICDDCGRAEWIDGGYRESWEGTTPEAVYGAESFNPYRRT